MGIAPSSHRQRDRTTCKMGNMEGCLRAAGLAAAEQHKSGDILPPIGSSTNRTDQPGGSVEELNPEDLPLPVPLEDALAGPASESVTESEPAEPEAAEPEPAEPEPEPTISEHLAVEASADGSSGLADDGALDDDARQHVIDQANDEFDRLDTNGDGTLSREEFAASAGEVEVQLADPDDETAANAEVPEYRRKWTEQYVGAEVDGDTTEMAVDSVNEAMGAWRDDGVLEPESEGNEPVDGLHKFLDAVKTGFGAQYTSALKEGGFETGRALSLASAKDLQQCGVALGHALLIVDTVQKVAKYC